MKSWQKLHLAPETGNYTEVFWNKILISIVIWIFLLKLTAVFEDIS